MSLGGDWGGGVLRVPPVGFTSQLSLRREALQVAHEAQAQRVLDVQPLARHQVPRHLGRALAEPDAVVIHGVALGVVCERVQTWSKEI